VGPAQIQLENHIRLCQSAYDNVCAARIGYR
jgi:hypothetical protein